MSNTDIKNKKVLVAMSGGVDSSVAAYLLKEQGYSVVGVTMCLGIKDVKTNSKVKCCGTEAIDDAKKVCHKLNISHYVLDFSEQLEEYVIKNFVEEYVNGRTPNPCIKCNEFLKFGKLLKYSKSMGFNFLATGHFAKISISNNEFYLTRPKDAHKDQTYFLYSIQKSELKRILFPLSGLTKTEVREIARKSDLPVASKPQSQDVCFVPDNNYKRFVAERTESINPGNIVNLDGEILGTHTGIINYTRGQRGGLGIAVGKPQYVVAINSSSNQIVIGDKEDLLTNELIASKLNIFSKELPDRVFVQIRYGHKQSEAIVELQDDNKARIKFLEPQEAVTKGQAVVFYNNDIVLGGGTIESYS